MDKAKMDIQVVGTCRFCGQTRVYDWELDDPDEEATKDCVCRDGEAYRERSRVLTAAGENIEAIFGEKMPDVAEVFQGLKGQVYDGRIGTVTIKLPGGAAARISMPSASAMKVEYIKTTVTELSTGI